MNLHPVILAGGSGTRLWPMSRESHPKQFLALMEGSSPFQGEDDIVRLEDLSQRAETGEAK